MSVSHVSVSYTVESFLLKCPKCPYLFFIFLITRKHVKIKKKNNTKQNKNKQNSSDPCSPWLFGDHCQVVGSVQGIFEGFFFFFLRGIWGILTKKEEGEIERGY